jgi:Ca2+-binding EF-hand superfamily protein
MANKSRVTASDDMLKEAFDLLDAEKVGRISSGQALFVVRALGFAPNEKQAAALEKSIGQTHVDFPKLKQIYKDVPADVKQPGSSL